MPKRWEEIQASLGPERQARAQRRAEDVLLEMDLRELCAIAGKTQQQVAALVEQRQDQTSEAERRKDTRHATLRWYVEALGGELELVAHIGRRRMRLRA